MNKEQRIQGKEVQVKLLSLQPGPTVDADEMVIDNVETPRVEKTDNVGTPRAEKTREIRLLDEKPASQNMETPGEIPFTETILRKEVSGDASYLNLKLMGSLMQ